MPPALTRRISTGPILVSTVAAFLLADVTLIWIGLQADFAIDFTCCYQQAAERAITDAGTLYDWSETYTFRYTPLGSLLWVPLVPLDESSATWAWMGFKLAVLVAAAAWFSSRWSGWQRWAVGAAVVTFPPIVHDLMIGNVSTLTVLALLALARWRGPRAGIAIGLLTALMPKPHLVPVLAFLAVRRPRDFAVTLVTMAVGVLLGALLFGVEPWIAYVESLREPLERTFTANVGFSGLLGPVGVIVGLATAGVLLGMGIWIGGARGYGLSIISGAMMGPYTFIHYLAGTIVAVEPTLVARPRRLTIFPWLLIAFPLIPVWLLALGWVVRSTPEGETMADLPANRGHSTSV